MKENYKDLLAKINKKLPIDVYIDDVFISTYYYKEDKDIYQGQIGYLTYTNVLRWIRGDEDLNHLTIKEHKNEN